MSRRAQSSKGGDRYTNRLVSVKQCSVKWLEGSQEQRSQERPTALISLLQKNVLGVNHEHDRRY